MAIMTSQLKNERENFLPNGIWNMVPYNLASVLLMDYAYPIVQGGSE